MKPFIKINDLVCPYPNQGLGFQVSTFVNSARNSNGVVVGQRVGRDQQKIDSLEWFSLTAQQWSEILQEFQKGFFVTVTYPDMVENAWTTRTMYPGDRTATPIEFNPITMLPTKYKNCKVNLTDCGEDL